MRKFASRGVRTRALVVAVAMLLVGVPTVVADSAAVAVTSGPGITSVRLPLPPDANADSNPNIAAVSCGAPGFCVAVGTYRPATSGSNTGLIETLSGGTWTATRSPFPAGAYGSGLGGLDGVSCAGSSTCAAYGLYATSQTASGYMALIRSGGVWKAQSLTAPSGGSFSNGTFGGPSPVSGVGCTGVDACALVGNFYNSGNALRGWTSIYHTGQWGGLMLAPTPNDATAQETHLNAMSCSSGLCQAVGNYTNPAGWQPLVVSIDPVADTANSPSSPLPMPTGGELDDLNGVACDPSGGCVAYGAYWPLNGQNEEGLVFPVGGTAFQPQQPPTATAASSTIHPAQKVNAASCAGGACLIAGNYFDTSGTYRILLDRFGAGGWTADAAPTTNVPNLAACGAAAFCVAAATSPYGQPLDVLTSAGWSAPALGLPADTAAGTSSSAFEAATACDSATSCWLLGEYSAVAGTSSISAVYADHVTPTSAAVPPSVSTAGWPAFALGAAATLHWHGSAGTAAIAHYVVQVRRAPWNGGFGAWSTPAGWGALSAGTTALSVPMPVGYDTCVRVQAVDAANQYSAWSTPRCTARPIDDRALAASAGWTRANGAGYYLGTYTSTKTLNATMARTSVQFDQLALVATTCPTCGKIAVYSGTTLLGIVNLYRTTTARAVLILLPKISLRTATVRLRVVTSGKWVQIDGLGISRS